MAGFEEMMQACVDRINIVAGEIRSTKTHFGLGCWPKEGVNVAVNTTAVFLVILQFPESYIQCTQF